MKITSDEIKKFRKAGLLDETGLRNFLIYIEFKTRKKHYPRRNYLLIEKLADEFNVSYDSVVKAVYRYRSRKSVYDDEFFENDIPPSMEF